MKARRGGFPAQAKRVEDRVLLALWHFAGRWREPSGQRRVVRLPVTGDILAQIVGARRQTISTGLGALQTRDAIRRLPDSAWLIPVQPTELGSIEVGQRASDREPQALSP